MPSRKPVTATDLRAAITEVLPWLHGGAPQPPRPTLAAAVRLSLRTLEQDAPGHTVEVRVPPFAAVQCIEGPRHTRGNPPNTIETDPRTWLELATGTLDWHTAVAESRVSASGSRADLSDHLPLLRF